MQHLVRLWTKRAASAALLSALLFPALGYATPSRAEDAAETLPARVKAVYRINFGVLGDIGWFSFVSDLKDDDYKLVARAKVDTAVFEYVGRMKSEGVLDSAATKPADYLFAFRQEAVLGKKKQRTLKMAFDKTGVKKIKFVPPDPPSIRAIPVTEEHLKGALDPLSGIMALSLGDLAKPCDQKLPIFDGKQRFDIVFKPARSGPASDPGAQVCNVRLKPIAGHKKGEGADSVITGEIEVLLAPVPKANIIVPKKVTVPTIIGAAELVSESIEIIMPNKQRFALNR